MKRTPLERKSRLARKPMRRSQPKRDWSEARAKVEREHRTCRICYREGFYDPQLHGLVEAAHVVGREHDKAPATIPFQRGMANVTLPHPWHVNPVRIVPLCRKHHRAYDAHELDLLPYLTVEEQAQAVLDAGGIELARKRTCPSAYRRDTDG